MKSLSDETGSATLDWIYLAVGIVAFGTALISAILF